MQHKSAQAPFDKTQRAGFGVQDGNRICPEEHILSVVPTGII
jgi:hypothetical protein